LAAVELAGEERGRWSEPLTRRDTRLAFESAYIKLEPTFMLCDEEQAWTFLGVQRLCAYC
jgi:hypothetical protein